VDGSVPDAAAELVNGSVPAEPAKLVDGSVPDVREELVVNDPVTVEPAELVDGSVPDVREELVVNDPVTVEPAELVDGSLPDVREELVMNDPVTVEPAKLVDGSVPDVREELVVNDPVTAEPAKLVDGSVPDVREELVVNDPVTAEPAKLVDNTSAVPRKAANRSASPSGAVDDVPHRSSYVLGERVDHLVDRQAIRQAVRPRRAGHVDADVPAGNLHRIQHGVGGRRGDLYRSLSDCDSFLDAGLSFHLDELRGSGMPAAVQRSPNRASTSCPESTSLPGRSQRIGSSGSGDDSSPADKQDDS